jgi:hypothetical protein
MKSTLFFTEVFVYDIETIGGPSDHQAGRRRGNHKERHYSYQFRAREAPGL